MNTTTHEPQTRSGHDGAGSSARTDERVAEPVVTELTQANDTPVAVETAAPSTAAPDIGAPDAGVTDSGVTDSGVTDSGVTDSGVTDSGVTETEAVAPAVESRRRPPVVVPDKGKTSDGYLRCPTPKDDNEPLLQQTIHASDCGDRQRGGYYKCFDCKHCSIQAFDGDGLPPLDNSPSHLSDVRLAGLNPILY